MLADAHNDLLSLLAGSSGGSAAEDPAFGILGNKVRLLVLKSEDVCICACVYVCLRACASLWGGGGIHDTVDESRSHPDRNLTHVLLTQLGPCCMHVM